MEEKTMVPLGNSEIIWCNYEDRFITFGDELTLHVVDQWRETNRVFGEFLDHSWINLQFLSFF